MLKGIEIIKATRKAMLNMVNELSIQQINKVPQGFNNNIIWNLGHLLVSQQGLCYKRAGVPMLIEEALFEQFKPDTKPEADLKEAEISFIKTQFLLLINQLEIDYSNHHFANYTPFTNRFGVEVTSIDDAFKFINFHEGIHFGYVLALRRLVK
jgi:hypothetical protein